MHSKIQKSKNDGTSKNKEKNLVSTSTNIDIDTWILNEKIVDKLVYNVADFSYLSSKANERFDISHFYHGRCKFRTESWRAFAILGHNTIRRSSVKKYLIWLKEAFSLNEILEVIVIKRIGCHHIQGCKIIITIPIINRTPASPGASKASINVSPIVVYSIADGHASCLAYCMGTCIF